MILKDYQAEALEQLEEFLRLLDEEETTGEAFRKFWRDEPETLYHTNIAGVPQVCFKVPTGGGKTFMAAASLKVIFDAMPAAQSEVVVWLVPSETILTQTYRNLSNPTHPYRRQLAADFNGRVAVYTKAQLLAGENFSPAEVAEQLSIFVLSYDSFRATNKDGRKAYQQNGQLYSFAAQLAADEEISLVNVIRHYQPVVIVDESHRATTDLSVEMLTNFNPSFILELTATPKQTSNVIAYVPAAKLKANSMVKLPVIVCNRHTQAEVISDAIDLRNNLEDEGRREGVRPIVLFQAEAQGNDDRATFDKIKAALIDEHSIPAEQIAIKTANVNDLRGVDLMAADCPVRYVITVNALKEGWDCPFAYVLASLANRTSVIDVEQILGRILRRPFTKKFSNKSLNMSYVLTSSADFHATLDKIVVGLNAAGFSEREYTIGKFIGKVPQPDEENDPPKSSPKEHERMTTFEIREMFSDARDLVLPQFVRKGDKGYEKVSRSTFREKFSLADKDTDINFDNLNYEIVAVDVQGREDAPRYKYLSDARAKAFLEYFNSLTSEGQIRQCTDRLVTIIDKSNAPSTQEIRRYVAKIVARFDKERLQAAVQRPGVYARKIIEKIEFMMTEHAQKNFRAQITARKIFVKPSYRLPASISLTKYNRNWSNSLYAAEDDDINNLERKVAAMLTSLENVRWWHRNHLSDGFCLNGFINHYPDFIAQMKSGLVLLIEAKGDDRDNSDSRHKLYLGRAWESIAGVNEFGYFMVFDSNPIDGALTYDEFVARLKEL